MFIVGHLINPAVGFGNLANWDGRHFLAIAQGGYNAPFEYAFFPLYPLIVRVLGSLMGNFIIAAVLFNLGCLIGGLIILYQLVNDRFGRVVAFKTLAFLLLFPTSFYFLAVYSESLFFILTVATFYFLDKKQIFFSSLCAAFCSLTRLPGVAVVLILIYFSLRDLSLGWRRYLSLLSLVGLFSYMVFLNQHTGNPVFFLDSEKHWGREFSLVGYSFWNSIVLAVAFFHFDWSYFMNIFDLLFAVFGVGIALRSWRFLPVKYSSFALLAVVIPLVTTILISMPRFLLPIFPIFITLSLIKNQRWIVLYTGFSLGLLVLFTMLYIQGIWVS